MSQPLPHAVVSEKCRIASGQFMPGNMGCYTAVMELVQQCRNEMAVVFSEGGVGFTDLFDGGLSRGKSNIAGNIGSRPLFKKSDTVLMALDLTGRCFSRGPVAVGRRQRRELVLKENLDFLQLVATCVE